MADAVAASDALGTSAAVDSSGRLWVAYAEAATPRTHVVVVRSDDHGKHWGPAIRVTSKAAPVSADGENRPKLAFGPQGDVYVSWTSPTSAQYTADIRFARSLDGGATWSAPVVVHRDRQIITHRFESMVVGRDGRIWIAWIDKRDLAIAQAAQRDYAGAAVYYAYSDDRGATWRGDFKVADQSCECCRIALATDAAGPRARPVATRVRRERARSRDCRTRPTARSASARAGDLRSLAHRRLSTSGTRTRRRARRNAARGLVQSGRGAGAGVLRPARALRTSARARVAGRRKPRRRRSYRTISSLSHGSASMAKLRGSSPGSRGMRAEHLRRGRR